MTVQRIPPTILIPAASQLLVDLPTVKEELAIDDTDTAKDTWLNLVIGQVSRSISAYCNRTFVVEQLQETLYIQQDPYPYQVPGGVSALQLSRWPLANFTLLPLAAPAAAGDTVLNFGSNTSAAEALLGIVSGPGIAAGTTIGIAEAALVLSAPVTAAMAAGTLVAFGLAVSQTLSGSLGGSPLVQSLAATLHYQIDAREAQLIRLDGFTGIATLWEALPTTVIYSAGYATIPEDIVVAALRWVSWRFAERGRDPTLRAFDQPLVGNKQFWVGGPPSSGGVPREIADLLAHYRTPVVT